MNGVKLSICDTVTLPSEHLLISEKLHNSLAKNFYFY